MWFFFPEFWRQHYIPDSRVDIQNFSHSDSSYLCVNYMIFPLLPGSWNFPICPHIFTDGVGNLMAPFNMGYHIAHSCEISGNSYYWDNQTHIQIYSNSYFFFLLLILQVFFQPPYWVLYFCYVIFTCGVPFHYNFIFFIVSFSSITVAVLPQACLAILIIMNFWSSLLPFSWSSPR